MKKLSLIHYNQYRAAKWWGGLFRYRWKSQCHFRKSYHKMHFWKITFRLYFVTLRILNTGCFYFQICRQFGSHQLGFYHPLYSTYLYRYFTYCMEPSCQMYCQWTCLFLGICCLYSGDIINRNRPVPCNSLSLKVRNQDSKIYNPCYLKLPYAIWAYR